MSEDWIIKGQDVGLIGPASLRFHSDHALGFADNQAIDSLCSRSQVRALDLGSGGGLPGLVLAQRFVTSQWVLLDSRKRSVEHLQTAIASCALSSRVSVVVGRGEDLARLAHLREAFDLVTARGFGAPAVVAEIGSGFVSIGGSIVVSEPPDGGTARWDDAGLASLGLVLRDEWESSVGHYRRLEKVASLDERFPRRNGVPKKQPLF